MTALDGFEAEKCAPSSTGAIKPLGGRQPAPPAEQGERGGSVGLGGGSKGGSEGGSEGGGEGGGGEGGGGEGAPIVTNTDAP